MAAQARALCTVLCWSIYIMAVMNEGGRWPALCAAGWLCDGRSLNIQGERKKKFFSESLRATCGARESQGSCFQNKKQTASLKFLDTVPLKISSCLFTMVSISKCFHHRYFACQSEKTCIYISQNGDHCKRTVGDTITVVCREHRRWIKTEEKAKQRSSLLFGGQNWFNYLPR